VGRVVTWIKFGDGGTCNSMDLTSREARGSGYLVKRCFLVTGDGRLQNVLDDVLETSWWYCWHRHLANFPCGKPPPLVTPRKLGHFITSPCFQFNFMAKSIQISRSWVSSCSYSCAISKMHIQRKDPKAVERPNQIYWKVKKLR
jgi:hypothetical protein